MSAAAVLPKPKVVAQEAPIARGPITFSLMLATIMYSIDSTIANVALPHMQGSLSASLDQITWVLTSFIVAQALMTPLVGFITDHIGRKQLMLYSVVGFTVSSAACGLAGNLYEEVLFRILQGVSGAAFIPLSQATLFDINPPEKHGQAMALFGMGVVLGPILGPVLGGWITDNLSWRWVFFINVPVGVLAFLGVSAFLPERKAEVPRKFVFLGYAALGLFIACLQLLLDRGPTKDWFQSWEIWIEATLAGAGLWIFVVHTIVAEKPYFERAILKDWNFVAGCVVSVATGLMLFASLALLPPMMQNILGWPVVKIGLVTAPRGIGMLIGMTILGRIITRMDPRILLLIGFGLNAVSLWQMTLFAPDMDDSLIVISGIFQGIGIGMIFPASNALAFASLPGSLRTDAAAFFTLARSLGSAVGISVMQAVLVANIAASYSGLIQNVRPDNPNMAAMPLDLSTTAGLATMTVEVARQALMIAYIDDFKLAMWMSIAIMPLVFLLRRPKRAASSQSAASSESKAAPHALPE
jgi:DHA2 family multidrug resistance protein